MTEHATPSGDHAPPPGARTMNVVRWVLFAGLLVLALASTVSYVVWRRSESTTHLTAARYHCPMHPTYTSDRPGECPICGMDLEPIPAGAAASAPDSNGVPGLTAVTLDPERVQMIGVRTAAVERRAVGQRVELVGFVTPDEGLLREVQIRVPGWVVELHVSRTGARVLDGAPLLTIDSPELSQSEQEFLIESSVNHGEAPRDSSGHGHESGAPSAAKLRLRRLGVPEVEIQRLERERVPRQRLTLLSPVNGTVLERNVTQGEFVGPGTTLFTVANLSRVWVMADLYEMDLGRVHVGDAAVFTAEGIPGRSFRSRVEFVYPTVSTETRTVKLRLALANPDGALRPGMYGRVALSARPSAAMAVPVESVVRTGDETYVFVARAGGRFEPRRVVAGSQDGEWTQILSGLAVGDTVVASASFLIDSESRLKAAIDGMGAHR